MLQRTGTTMRRGLTWLCATAMLGLLLAVAPTPIQDAAGAIGPCPSGTATSTVVWGVSGGVVWDDAIQNTGLTRTYTNVAGAPIDMTMSIVDPSNMNEDGDNPLINLPTADGNWDPPLYTRTDGVFGPGYLTVAMTSLDTSQEVTFTLDFSAPILVSDLTVADIDYVGNGAPSNSDPHDSYQDEVTFSASRNGAPVGIGASTGSPTSPVMILNDPTTGRLRVIGGPYMPGVNGDLGPNDPAGTIAVETLAPVTSLSLTYANGADDEAGDATALALAGGTWPAANWAPPMTATSTGVSNNHAIRLNAFDICTGTLSIGDRVWADIDGDGVQDLAEQGIAGVTVTLLDPDGFAVATAITDAAGNYLFTDLLPWDYSVQISDTPAGYTSTFDRDGSIATPDNDSGTITLTTSSVTDADFGLQPPLGTVSGTVFADRGDDGTLDAPDGDTGLGGIALTLTGTDGTGNAVSLATTTAADGTYAFSGIPNGIYNIVETQPTDYTDGRDTPGTNAVSAGNDDHRVQLDLGESSVGNDFAEIPTASVAGTVFVDDDNDAQPDIGEAGISGVTLTLSGTDDAGNGVSLTTATSTDGSYVFDALRPGTYTVTETQPAPYLDGRDDAGSQGGDTSVNDRISDIVLPIGVAATDYDFAELDAASISGSVVDDAGTGIPGTAVALTGTDDLGNAVLAFAGTDVNGNYTFGGLRPGTYTVTETQPVGYGDGGETAGSEGGDDSTDDVITNIAVGAGVDATDYDFDETTGAISGSVRDDAGTGIPNTTLTLTGTDDLGNTVDLTTNTDAGGRYRFDQLIGGTYTVTETQPVGYGDGGETAGSEGGDDSTDDVITNIAVGAGVDATDYDFDETTGAISGSVFEDNDNDGQPDPGETGIEGVTITLTGTDDLGNTVDLTTTTDTDGDYSFPGLLSGGYTLDESQPTGYADGQDDAGTQGGDTSVNDRIARIILPGGVDATDYDFAELELSTISGTVFEDRDNDGAVDPAEVGIAGVTISLSGTDDLGDTIDLTTTTDAAGTYTFGGLRPGTYTLAETQPADYLDGTEVAGSAGGDDSVDDEITAIVLDAFTGATGYDFGELPPASIGGSVVDDQGRAIPGTTLTLSGTDERGNPVIGIATTDVDGNYTFDGLRPGTYTVTETQPAGYGDGGETAGSEGGDDSTDDVISNIRIGIGTQASGYDFDETTAAISGSVFHDRDGDGVASGGEPPIAGVTVTLTGIDDIGNAVSETTTTDVTGAYRFDQLIAGTYVITETQPPAYVDGIDSPGSAGGDASVNDVISDISLAPGTSATDYDFAELGSPIEGTVWLDTDEDGRIDAEETRRLAGVELTLIDDNGLIVATTTTDASGNYEFSSVVAGDYHVVETQPGDYGSTTQNDVAITVPVGGLPNIDFGEDPATITGRVWDDEGQPDGIQGPAEPGVAGVSVELRDAEGSLVATATTDPAGGYAFDDLPAGEYTVEIDPPTGDTVTVPDAGTDDTLDSDVHPISHRVRVSVDPGERSEHNDAGLVRIRRDLEVGISIDEEPTWVNDPADFTITAKNSGNTPVTGGADVQVTFPEGIRVEAVVSDRRCEDLALDATSGCWEIVMQGKVVDATWTGDLLPGEMPPPLVVETTIVEPGDLDVTATIATADGSVETTLVNNEDRLVVTVVERPPALAFTGSSVGRTLLGALSTLLIGFVLTLTGRRRSGAVPRPRAS